MSEVRSRTALSLASGSLEQMDAASRRSGRSGAKIPNEANFLPYRTDIVSPCELGCSVASSPRLPNSPHSQDRTLARLEERRCHRRAACQAAPQIPNEPNFLFNIPDIVWLYEFECGVASSPY